MIEVNGKKLVWEEGMTVRRVLQLMNYTFPLIIVRVNGELIDNQDWDTALIPQGASVQALHQMAGG